MFRILLLFLIITGCTSKPKSYSQNLDEQRQILEKNKVKQVNVYEYEYKFGSPDTTNGFIIEVHKYDTKGNETWFAEYKKSEILRQYNSTSEYKYDSYNNNIETFIFNADMKPSDIIKNNFTNNLLNERVIYNPDGSLKGKAKYKYDNDRNLIEIASYDEKGKLEYKTNWEFDRNGKEIGSMTTSNDTLYNERTSVRYITDTNQLFFVYNHKNELRHTYEMKKNSKGQVIETKFHFPEDGYPTIEELKYDANGLLTEKVKYSKFNENATLVKYIYDRY